MPTDDNSLLHAAQTWVWSDPTVRGCWHLVVQGIELKWLEVEELHELLTALRKHEEYGIQELLFSYSGEELQVSFLDDRTTCAPDALIAELSSFLTAIHA